MSFLIKWLIKVLGFDCYIRMLPFCFQFTLNCPFCSIKLFWSLGNFLNWVQFLLTWRWSRVEGVNITKKEIQGWRWWKNNVLLGRLYLDQRQVNINLLYTILLFIVAKAQSTWTVMVFPFYWQHIIVVHAHFAIFHTTIFFTIQA